MQRMRRVRLALVGLASLGGLGSLGCGDLVGNAALPPGTQSPTIYNTPDGALAFYQGAKKSLRLVLEPVILDAGALTDELAWWGRGTSPVSIGATGDPTDERLLPESPTQSAGATTYLRLQQLRGNALQGIGLLRTYAPQASPALAGELQALEGYAEVLLGELYCSGVPLSTLDFQKDFTYKPSSTTEEVLRHAAALADSAVALSTDSARVVWFAQMVKGRALLDLGNYAAAAQAVTGVPDTFSYTVAVPWTSPSVPVVIGYTVADREGGTGLPFTSNGDPRAAVARAMPDASNPFGLPLFVPKKYPLEVTTATVVASGVEARLIEAEAALQAGDARWLTILNALRTDGTVARTYTRTCTNGVSPCPAGVVDTTWGAGTGAYLIPAAVLADQGPVCPPSVACTDTAWYKGLRPLADPGSADARLAVLFQERAYWLFLTGHRQGDLRRLVRNYHRPQDAVYPVGPYYGGQGFYGSDVTLPIPPSELPNPLFHGCLGREA